jgi:hypothetical protein
MEEHWLAGREDVERTFNHPAWKNRTRPEEGVKVLDLTRESRLIHAESACKPTTYRAAGSPTASCSSPSSLLPSSSTPSTHQALREIAAFLLLLMHVVVVRA